MKAVPVNLSLVLQQQIPVQNLKPAVIALYDYYQPTDRAEREYTVANQGNRYSLSEKHMMQSPRSLNSLVFLWKSRTIFHANYCLFLLQLEDCPLPSGSQ
ncbi:hypothetical protein ILYODFUR_029782 [Ilyodon furcidens]|uniref:Alpha-macroglobulin receptor-binding domain-containing protein n=1 Tax=Ilyodon furcidens TaxID=33524 RepID=A0ABV0TRL0_9TELE